MVNGTGTNTTQPLKMVLLKNKRQEKQKKYLWKDFFKKMVSVPMDDEYDDDYYEEDEPSFFDDLKNLGAEVKLK